MCCLILSKTSTSACRANAGGDSVNGALRAVVFCSAPETEWRGEHFETLIDQASMAPLERWTFVIAATLPESCGHETGTRLFRRHLVDGALGGPGSPGDRVRMADLYGQFLPNPQWGRG
jgi:hypothetical protein